VPCTQRHASAAHTAHTAHTAHRASASGTMPASRDCARTPAARSTRAGLGRYLAPRPDPRNEEEREGRRKWRKRKERKEREREERKEEGVFD